MVILYWIGFFCCILNLGIYLQKEVQDMRSLVDVIGLIGALVTTILWGVAIALHYW